MMGKLPILQGSTQELPENYPTLLHLHSSVNNQQLQKVYSISFHKDKQVNDYVSKDYHKLNKLMWRLRYYPTIDIETLQTLDKQIFKLSESDQELYILSYLCKIIY